MDRRGFFLGGALGVGVTGASLGAWNVLTRKPEPRTRRSYAQQGEDIVLDAICGFLGIDQPTYLDIGAYDPIEYNNTYLFYEKGCRGVLVEPNPGLSERLKSVRPGDVVLNVGIGTGTETIAKYYLIGGPGGQQLNTFSREQAEGYRAKTGGKFYLAGVIDMPLVNLNAVLHDHFRRPPDILSIDTEGLDLGILKTLDFTSVRPALLCVETMVFGTTAQDPSIAQFLTAKGYDPRGATFVNTIFVNRQLL